MRLCLSGWERACGQLQVQVLVQLGGDLSLHSGQQAEHTLRKIKKILLSNCVTSVMAWCGILKQSTNHQINNRSGNKRVLFEQKYTSSPARTLLENLRQPFDFFLEIII